MSYQDTPFFLWSISEAWAWLIHVHPIEQAFSKLKAHLRKHAERSIETLWDRIGALIAEFSAAECQNFFRHAGYA